jgi:hypothetical protein
MVEVKAATVTAERHFESPPRPLDGDDRQHINGGRESPGEKQADKPAIIDLDEVREKHGRTYLYTQVLMPFTAITPVVHPNRVETQSSQPIRANLRLDLPKTAQQFDLPNEVMHTYRVCSL